MSQNVTNRRREHFWIFSLSMCGEEGLYGIELVFTAKQDNGAHLGYDDKYIVRANCCILGVFSLPVIVCVRFLESL